jgi:hypothetical protein
VKDKDMDREDIIRMAVEADPGFDGGQNVMELLSNSIVGIAAIERFAALVAAHERERIIAANAPEIEKINEYIKALEHEFDCPRCGHCCPQPEQEPVKDRLDFWALFDENQRLRAELKLNTTPPRQWVGLTKDEIKSLPNWWPSYEDSMALIELVKDVEAKLKEKNT